jgi:hypothetical protein
MKSKQEERISLKPPNDWWSKINKGLNLIRIGGFIAGLLKKEKKISKKIIPQLHFHNNSKKTVLSKTFIETLKIKTRTK